MRKRSTVLALAAAALALGATAQASSHREAPAITELPKVDATDFYFFRSYEPGREGFVTLVANFLPLQDPYGGPNYFTLDPEALYEIKLDTDGDANENVSFQFRFDTLLRELVVPVGPEGQEVSVPVPLANTNQIAANSTASLNVLESYTVDVVRYDNRNGKRGRAVAERLRNADNGADSFAKPADYIGEKSFPNYEAYAAAHVYDIDVPGCSTEGRLFVGQRKDPFVVNLGETFDLINYANSLGPVDAENDDLAYKNVTSLVLEIPIECLVGESPTIGAWCTASLPQKRAFASKPKPDAPLSKESGAFRQVSRLGMPLVNEVVIGLPDKDLFNASAPVDDAQFLQYVTHPVLPELIQTLFPAVQAPNLFPREDLVAAFLTGVPGLNETATPCEMVRLNTSIEPTLAVAQSNLGVLGGDVAGFPNGRRPGDDVVDIELRVAMGFLIFAGAFGNPEDAPSGHLPFTDGAKVDASFFDATFPYLTTPIPGSIIDK